jgi:hypothetical protein
MIVWSVCSAVSILPHSLSFCSSYILTYFLSSNICTELFSFNLMISNSAAHNCILFFFLILCIITYYCFSYFSFHYVTSGQKQSYEETLSITYQPLSVFRVRPVTRCVETMPGHTDAVLHVSYSPDGKRLGAT